MSERAVTCTAHCGACGQHFTSLRAFDLHREGPWAERTCTSIEDSGGEVVVGVCQVYGERRRASVWRLTAGIERARAVFHSDGVRAFRHSSEARAA